MSQEMSWSILGVYIKFSYTTLKRAFHESTAKRNPTLDPRQDPGTQTCQTVFAAPRCRPVRRGGTSRQFCARWCPHATVVSAKVVSTLALLGLPQRLIWIVLTTKVYWEDSDVAADVQTGEKQKYISVNITDTPRKEQTFRSRKFVHEHWDNKLYRRKRLIVPWQTYLEATFCHIL